MTILAATPASATRSPGASDLRQIAPIAALVGFWLLAMVVDLLLPARRGGAVAIVSAVGSASR